MAHRSDGVAEPRAVEVQDKAFSMATQSYHYPKTGLVSLRSPETAPVAYQSSGSNALPRWRQYVQGTPLDADLFPLHSPVNYVDWLGTQKKRLVELGQTRGP